MDSHDIERAARIARTAIGLGVSLALLPVRLALRALRPPPAPDDEARWAPVEAAEPAESPAESPPPVEPVPVAPPDPAVAAEPQDEPEAPAAPPEPSPSPHAGELTSAEAARRREAEREAETTPDSPGPELRVEEPWPGYDAMTVAQVRERLAGADPTMRALVRLYEERHKNRKGVLQATE